ncbi:carboxylating nicotinate-nucleotide diphosphorylase [Celerinatantimonas diazotrophica]|uniref:Probable nicotinate-nucleotide pyrophosphorylase [carboxylating] n=1 Tax=Celerinatantimonas diazotrophica TaxID=412034 RepID=A0A4R1J8P5_9GAMM|nr:carboxylating nicotinate-nucleotide diphosphorylase [Celerinatantimonas diazotrophica]TCK46737.1 nicotinate-nucleotide pyrophosphorylase [carboxylating] [Celerinatantimonas diazotrophica]CAG9295439.1 putative nicotinate-nucleotide pyrophosphorylase [carboxylating] [Celerinatantimonas diazotrophica]
MYHFQLRTLLSQFFQEDIGFGDLSAEAIFANEQASGSIVAKQPGVFCGSSLITQGYKLLNEQINITTLVNDGEVLNQGSVIAKIEGPVREILTGERVILNLIQRLSGIASATAQAVTILDDPNIRICDTRKTTPGLRMLEKYAFKMGGGHNHRFGLDDGVMIKDNHIAACGSIANAMARVRKAVGHMVKIEVEIETRQQLEQAIAAKADVIMFDNCSAATVREFRALTPANIITEASGGITLENLAEFRHSGVDVISLGCLTHSVKALDISLDL